MKETTQKVMLMKQLENTRSNNLLFFFAVFGACFVFSCNSTFQNSSLGEPSEYFKTKCSSCHHPVRELVAPPLREVFVRLDSVEVFNLVRSGGNSEGKKTHPQFSTLSDSDIVKILTFVYDEDKSFK
ncbi:MAG: hypothetical protein ACI9YL_000508 [Luteibaculaceae bacterium]|jgi:hypothetical protein